MRIRRHLLPALAALACACDPQADSAYLGEPLITDAILREGVGLDEARKQVADLAAYVRTLGTVRLEIDEQDTSYNVDVVWEYKK